MTDPGFWFLIAFAVCVGVLLKLGVRPAARALHKRGKDIEAQIRAAARMRREAEVLLADIRQKRINTDRHAAEILAHAREESERFQHEAELEFDKFAKAKERMVEERIAYARERALQEIREQAVNAALARAEKTLQENGDATFHQHLTDKALTDLKKVRPS